MVYEQGEIIISIIFSHFVFHEPTPTFEQNLFSTSRAMIFIETQQVCAEIH